MPDSVQDLIRREAQAQGVPPELALAVAQQESSFNPTLTNPTSGAIGTFQILPTTGQMLGVDPTDPRQNISGGVKYLRQLMDKHQGDLRSVLAEYGGVKTDTTYVPSVLNRIPTFKQSNATAGGPPKPQADALTNPFPVSNATIGGRTINAARSVLGGFDVRTPKGRQNVAGAVGSAAATYLAPELTLPNLLRKVYQVGVPLAGAYAGGATEQAGEDIAAGGPPKPASMRAAGATQMGTEAVGQAGTRLFVQPIARRFTAKGVSTKIAQYLSDAIDAAKGRLSSMQPAVTPSRAGRMVDAVAQGPAKDVKTQLGEAVEQAAATGPAIAAQPLRDRLADLAAQITPMASHQQTPAALKGFSPQQVQAIAAKNPQITSLLLPPDHPLPAALDRIREAIGTEDTIPYAEAHKIKTLLDSVVNWDRAAKKPAEQITKGFRQTLREQMAGHAPYDQATAAYGPVAKLYTRDVNTLHRDILSNPEGIVAKIGWDNPSGAKMLKELTVDVPRRAADVVPVTRSVAPNMPVASDKAQTWFALGHLSDEQAARQQSLYTKGGTIQRGFVPKGDAEAGLKLFASDENGHTIFPVPSDAVRSGYRTTPILSPQEAAQGEAAWSALRAAWTHENLIAAGPAKMLKTIQQMEASGNGQEFIRTMYGDPAGKMQLENLKQIGAAWEAAKARATEFSQTNLAQAAPPHQVAADVAAVAMHGHPIYKARAGFRLVFGPHEKEMVEWASHSPAATKFLVNHVLTGSNPGQALADFMRYFQDVTGGEPESSAPPPQPTAGSPTTTPPPQPRALSAR